MKQRTVDFLKKHRVMSTLRNYSLLTIGTIMVTVGFVLFSASTNIAAGGIGGLVLIIEHFTGWSLGLTTLALQIPAVILGFYYLGRFRFLVSVWYVAMLHGGTLDLVAYLFPDPITDDLLLNTLYGGVVMGAGGGLIFLGGGAFAGTSIISRIIQLKTGMPISQIFMYIDGGIILALGATFGWELALYSLVMLFIYGLATDYAMEGPSVIRTAFIVTDKPEIIANALFERMGIGVTGWNAQGMFTKREKMILFCSVYRPDVQVLQEIILETDPYAFVVIGQGHQANGGIMRPPKQKSQPQTQVEAVPSLPVNAVTFGEADLKPTTVSG